VAQTQYEARPSAAGPARWTAPELNEQDKICFGCAPQKVFDAGMKDDQTIWFICPACQAKAAVARSTGLL